jgi:hypothetical protein
MNKRKKQNRIISIVAGIGVVLILTVAWFASKEFRFKSYKNSVYDFSIKYPASWVFKENIKGAVVIFYSPLENDLDYFMESVNVVVQDISRKPMKLKAYSELAITQMEAVFGENMAIIESEPAFIADQSGYKFVFSGKGPEGELKYMSVWTIKGTSAYQVTYTSLASQYDRYISKVKRMFRSFRIKPIPG